MRTVELPDGVRLTRPCVSTRDLLDIVKAPGRSEWTLHVDGDRWHSYLKRGTVSVSVEARGIYPYEGGHQLPLTHRRVCDMKLKPTGYATVREVRDWDDEPMTVLSASYPGRADPDMEVRFPRLNVPEEYPLGQEELIHKRGPPAYPCCGVGWLPADTLKQVFRSAHKKGCEYLTLRVVYNDSTLTASFNTTMVRLPGMPFGFLGSAGATYRVDDVWRLHLPKGAEASVSMGGVKNTALRIEVKRPVSMKGTGYPPTASWIYCIEPVQVARGS